MPPAAPWPQIHGWLEGLIAAWGPFAVFWGCFFEGETAAMLGGLMAHRGLASWPLIAALAVAGAFLADQMWFFLARLAPRRGRIERLRQKARESRLGQRVEANRLWIALIYRFIPGTRILGPVLLAQTDMGWRSFVAANAAMSIVWGLIFTWIGYRFGDTAERLFGRLGGHHWLSLLLAVVGLGVILHLVIRHFARPQISAGGE